MQQHPEDSLPEPKPTDWLLAQGERDGFPMIVRMANAYTGLAPVPAYGHHLIVSVRFPHRRPNGLPSSEDADALESIENQLCGLLEMGNESLCVLVITNNGLRDFIFYTRDVEGVQHKLETAGPVFRGFVAELAIEPDEPWEIYQAFSRMLGHGREGRQESRSREQ
jgi:Family of unknown function (DUF695)